MPLWLRRKRSDDSLRGTPPINQSRRYSSFASGRIRDRDSRLPELPRQNGLAVWLVQFFLGNRAQWTGNKKIGHLSRARANGAGRPLIRAPWKALWVPVLS